MTPGYLPPPAPLRPPLTDKEIGRMRFRVQLLTLRGFPEHYAKRWADVLQHRDFSRDDRRLCAECANLRGDWSCAKRGVVIVDRLQRCPSFSWARPGAS